MINIFTTKIKICINLYIKKKPNLALPGTSSSSSDISSSGQKFAFLAYQVSVKKLSLSQILINKPKSIRMVHFQHNFEALNQTFTFRILAKSINSYKMNPLTNLIGM